MHKLGFRKVFIFEECKTMYNLRISHGTLMQAMVNAQVQLQKLDVWHFSWLTDAITLHVRVVNNVLPTSSQLLVTSSTNLNSTVQSIPMGPDPEILEGLTIFGAFRGRSMSILGRNHPHYRYARNLVDTSYRFIQLLDRKRRMSLTSFLHLRGTRISSFMLI